MEQVAHANASPSGVARTCTGPWLVPELVDLTSDNKD
jgi:hypothetical protein